MNVVRAFFLRRASVEPESESSSVVSTVGTEEEAGGVLTVGNCLSRIRLSLLPVGLTSGTGIDEEDVGGVTVDDADPNNAALVAETPAADAFASFFYLTLDLTV